MKAKQVCKLQENLAKEAIAYLVLYGTTVDVAPYRKAVTQVGTVWGLPIPDTQRWLDLIRQEEIADDIYSMWLHTDQIAAHAKKPCR